MSSGLYVWSQTAASNSTADSTINWAEGQAPSSVNDSARAMMAGIAKYRDDIAGSITTGGSSTSYTVASNQNFDTLAHLHGQMIAFVPNATSTNAVAVDVTLNVDSLGAKPIRIQPSVTLPTGTLVLGTPYIVTYNNTDGVFYLQNMVNPYVIPLAAGMDFWGTTTPNSSFAFPTGQAISRTTYATLFTLLSTTYGAGDGTTTFNLPDKTERVSVMKASSATRLTATYFGGNSTVLGATGGTESHTLTQAELPAFKPAITITDPGHVHAIDFSSGAGVVVTTVPEGSGLVTNSSAAVHSATTGITAALTSNLGSGNAHVTVQPTIVCNYIMRII